MELNKMAAAILIAGIIGMVTGKVTDALYGGGAHHGAGHEEKRGYAIEVAEAAEGGAPAAAAGPGDISALTADITAGQELFSKKCATCHTAETGGAAKTGPNLHGVVGRARASVGGFNYSKAMKEKGGSWSADDLNHFLFKPKAFVPGTMMAFAGLSKDQDRANVIGYLNSLR